MRVPEAQDPEAQDSELQDRAVADHYVAYLYPARDPADEKKRMIEGSPSRLAEVEHYLFQGRLPSPLRALVGRAGALAMMPFNSPKVWRLVA